MAVTIAIYHERMHKARNFCKDAFSLLRDIQFKFILKLTPSSSERGLC